MTTRTEEPVRAALWAYLVTTTNHQETWTPVGLAFPRQDGGFVLPLDCLGQSGKLVIRPPLPGEASLD